MKTAKRPINHTSINTHQNMMNQQSEYHGEHQGEHHGEHHEEHQPDLHYEEHQPDLHHEEHHREHQPDLHYGEEHHGEHQPDLHHGEEHHFVDNSQNMHVLNPQEQQLQLLHNIEQNQQRQMNELYQIQNQNTELSQLKEKEKRLSMMRPINELSCVIPSNTYTFENNNSGYCLDDAGMNGSPAASGVGHINSEECNSNRSHNQKFKVRTVLPNGSMMLQNSYVSAENPTCISDGGSGINSQFQMTKCDTSNINQQFSVKNINKNGTFALQNPNKSLCIDSGDGKRGSVYTLQKCDAEAKGQQFKMHH